MKKNKRTSLILISVLGLFLLLALAGFFAVNISRSWYLNRRPLVQIYSPGNHQPLTAGKPAMFHASALSKDGIARLELWADGVMIKADDFSRKGKPPPSAAVSSGWVPSTTGQHTLVAVAYTPGGIKGQGAVYPEALPVEPIGNHPRVEFVAQGDTLESIANANDTSVTSLQELNPDLGDGGLTAGDALFVPGGFGGEGAGSGGEVPEAAAEEPPDDVQEEPGIFDGLLLLFAIPFEDRTTVDETVSLRVDAQSLQTGAAYESLHCYISMAGSTPRWYPDVDSNQSTDESFAILEGNQWDIASHLGRDDGVTVSWPQNLAIPLAANCIGIAGSGTEAIDLGTIDLEIDPASWDGAPREVSSTGGEGVFVLGFRVVHIGIENVPKGIDDTISIPYDLGRDGTTLSWRYHPAPSEAPIDGFRVYFNDTLLWITPADRLQTEIAPEWFDPPCNSTHAFTISAFRYGPDDPESNPSDPLVFTTSLACEREILVYWGEMQTHDLGGLIEEHNVVGPAIGFFTVGSSSGSNVDEKTIDGTCFGPGICGTFGFSENDSYSLPDLLDYFGGTSGTSRAIINPSFDLIISYDWWDCDGTLLANHICEGSVTIPYASLDSTHELTIGDNLGNRCTVFVSLDQIGGPVGEGESEIVLPDLQISDISIDNQGLLNLDIINTGLASLPNRDLTVLVESRLTEEVIRHSFSDVEIEAGETIELSAAEITLPERPLDVCVTIDPDNEFLGAVDYLGGRPPVCGKLPDLYIFETSYQYHSDRLHIDLYNGGDANLVDATIEFAMTTRDGSSFRPPEALQNISIPKETHREVSFPLNGIRDQLSGGYSLTVDPHNNIDEKREENNTREVESPKRLLITWTQLFFPHFEGVDARPQLQEYNMQIMAKSEDERSLENWALGPYDADSPETYEIQPNRSVEIVLASDEQLEVEVAGQILDGDERIDLGRTNELFDRTENYGAPSGVAPEGDCTFSDEGEHIWRIIPEGEIGAINAPWVVYFTVCRLE